MYFLWLLQWKMYLKASLLVVWATARQVNMRLVWYYHHSEKLCLVNMVGVYERSTWHRPGVSASAGLQSFCFMLPDPTDEAELGRPRENCPRGSSHTERIRVSKRGCQYFASNPSHPANSLDHFAFSSLAKINNPHRTWCLEGLSGVMWETDCPWLLLRIVAYFGSWYLQRDAKESLQTGVWFMYSTLLAQLFSRCASWF